MGIASDLSIARKMNGKRNVRDEMRADLIKRLFAVAISVGAASTIARMKWVTEGIPPNLRECKQLSILIVALTATVLSWDGYLVAIENRPLGDFWRFAIDIALVFIYMFLLMTSIHLTWWLPIHALTFFLYVAWDFLSVREHTLKYYIEEGPQEKSVLRVYIGGLTDCEAVSRSPIITIVWSFYFLFLYLISRRELADHVFISSVFALAGLIFYRQDKSWRLSFLNRLALVSFLLLFASAYLKLGPGDMRLAELSGLM